LTSTLDTQLRDCQLSIAHAIGFDKSNGEDYSAEVSGIVDDAGQIEITNIKYDTDKDVWAKETKDGYTTITKGNLRFHVPNGDGGQHLISAPPHYSRLSPEPIDVINAWKLNFNRGNAIKYIARAGHKDNEIQDLEKAIYYLQDEVKRLKDVPIRQTSC